MSGTSPDSVSYLPIPYGVLGAEPTASVDIGEFGGVPDGVTDNTNAINDAIAAVFANGGGVVRFGAGTYLIRGCIQPPYTGTNTPVQKPLALIGAGMSPDSYLGNSIAGNRAPIGGTILDMQYAGGVAKRLAKIDTRGGGFLEIAHMTIRSGGSDNYRILRTTNTTLHVHHVVFEGNAANTGTTCVQDCIQLGGNISDNTLVLDTDADNSGFQGYGTRIGPQVFYRRLRRCVEIGSAGNSITIDGNVVDFTCGSATATDAPFVVYGNGYQTWGNVFKNNTVEINNYEYGYCLRTPSGGGGANYNYVETGTWDERVGFTQGVVYFETAAIYNTVMMVATDTGMEANIVGGPGAASNTVIGMSRTSTFASLKTWSNQNNILGGSVAIRTGGVAPRSQLDVGPGTGATVARINGGNTNSGDGAALFFDANGITRGSVGHYTAYFGGAYSTDMIFVSAAKVGIGTIGGGYLVQGTGNNVVVGKSGGGLGFYGSAGGTIPTITGSRGGNAALASFLTQMAGIGLLVDGTTA